MTGGYSGCYKVNEIHLRDMVSCMPTKKPDKIRRAAEQIAAVIEAHLSKLTPAEREARWRSFEKVTSRAGVRRARGGGRSQTQASRLVARGRAQS